MMHKALPLALGFGLLTAGAALASNIEADLDAITKQYNAAVAEEARIKEEMSKTQNELAIQEVTLNFKIEISQLKMAHLAEAQALESEVFGLKSQLGDKDAELVHTKKLLAQRDTQVQELLAQIQRMKTDGQFFREHFKDQVEQAMAEDAAKEAQQEQEQILKDVKKAVNK